MATITLDGNLPEQLPVREDGTPFPFAAAWNDRAVLAETRTELTAAIIDGYDELPEGEDGDTEALYARYKSTVHMANTMQQVLAAHATEEGTFDPSVESEDVLTSLFTDRGQRIDEISEWTHTVPLVLVATEYAPYTATAKPTGNVMILDPYTETTYLNSLHDLGVIEFFAQEA